MKVLVANLGSTSFKYRLFQMADESLLARGGIERIGSPQSPWFLQIGDTRREGSIEARDHAVALRHCLQQLSEPGHACLNSPEDLAAIGFKAVHAKGLSGVQPVDERVLSAMEEYAAVAPAHNPPYIEAMRLLAREFPNLPLIAAFETGFHQAIPPEHRAYAVPGDWNHQHGIRRYGFHGASHRYIAERSAQLLKRTDAKIISCHLGGSSSLCAIAGGKSVACSMGMSPQSGLPQNNRIGDFDIFALPALLNATGQTLEQILTTLASGSGFLGLCGLTDLRDIEVAAANGNTQCQDTIKLFVASVRHYLGAYLTLLNGADAIVFTGGMGENSKSLRQAICANLDWHGILLDADKNQQARGEAVIHADSSRVQLWIMPTNEEIIVARQTRDFVQRDNKG